MLAPGTRIGSRYVINRLLGQGGMSNLYIATDLQQNNAERVIKEMTARYADPNEQKMAENLFMREAQLLATLNHPHIPKVFDKFIFQGKYYLSMEYCKGDDLGKIIQDRGTVEEKWVASWGAQMATVLYYLHRQNPPIVFRDVKPSNIMIVNGQVKLIDFGIARHFTSSKKGDTMRIGSPGYAPPEQYSGQTDPRSDIYALGVTLHHAATGFDPTISQTPFLIPLARTLNPNVSAEMEALIARATQLDPDKRYENCLDMKRDLQVVMRNHGMIVGASIPFSSLSSSVSPVPTNTATTPTTSQAAVTTTPAPLQAATPVPVPVPVTSPPATASPTVTPTPRKKGKKKFILLSLLTLGLTLGATQLPADWRNTASAQFHNLSHQLQLLLPGPTQQLSEAERSLLLGGPVPAAAEELGNDIRQGKGTPEQLLAYQNALVYGSGKPLKHLSVIAPADQNVAATLAAWQRSNWNASNREGTLLIISLENVENDWGGAINRAIKGKHNRNNTPADALLVFPPNQRPDGWSNWFDKSPTLYWSGNRQKMDPIKARGLDLSPVDFSLVFQQMQLNDLIWLAKQPPMPSGSKHENFGGPETILQLFRQNPKSLLVVDTEQLKAMEGWPPSNGVKVITIVPPGALTAKPPILPSGYKLYALTQACAYTTDPTVADFFQSHDLQASVFDTISWVGSALLGETRQTGLSWHSNRSGTLESARFSLLESRHEQWVWLREGVTK